MSIRNQFILSFLGGCLWIQVAGCGGYSQNDMKKYALKNSPDPTEEPAAAAPSAPAPTAPQDPAAPVVATPVVTAPAAQPAVATADLEGETEAVTAEVSKELSDTLSPPSPPLQEAERVRRSVANMEKIVSAIEAYRAAKGVYPPMAHKSVLGKSLSWRVLLLPYLGYQDLYDQFKLDEPAFSPKNMKLAERIPSVYQSPDRYDTKTNYMLPIYENGVFHPASDPMSIHEVQDPLTATVFLLEVDDTQAVNWIEPTDYNFDPGDPVKGLGELRRGEFFVGWGSGLVTGVPLSVNPDFMHSLVCRNDSGFDVQPAPVMELIRPIDLAKYDGGASAKKAAAKEEGVTAESALDDSSLAKLLWEAAESSAVLGQSDDAWRWMMAAIVSGADPSRWEGDFRWVPGLRRPSMGVHIGVTVRGQVARGGQTPSAEIGRFPEERLELREFFIAATQPFGGTMLETLEEHALAVAPGVLHQEIMDRKYLPVESPISYIPPLPSESETRKRAMQLGCDALVIFDVTASSGIAVDISIVDVGKGVKIFDLPKLVFRPGPDAERALLNDEKYRDARWAFKDYLDDQITGVGWPMQLSAPMMSKRVAALGASDSKQPLSAMVEMRYYRTLKLVDDEQLLEAMRPMIGKENAISLILGYGQKKQRVLREWLPEDNPNIPIEVLRNARLTAKNQAQE